ncbi:sulfatase [Neorhodopirellula pilleata]|uniref:Arylsulfatase n=1 Tax=Neorhodopirellula pilleata TaxID=2714738 RepID=A0A5C5ZWH5_9BACT|nr:sulfatase [Neorhodopirellula pilleata]TWT91619.1 Arylsulfatase [Neorhodopirellula pilleata]
MRSPIRVELVLFVSLFLGGLSTSKADDTDNRPKDVLFIAVDDLNDWTGHLGGHVQASTPNIDRLVNRGMVFTNAHCAAPACNPSRAALMSGRRPYETGIYVNGSPSHEVLKDTVTINRHFLANGYQVLGGGKIYHGFQSEGRDDTWTQWIGNPKDKGPLPHNVNGLDQSHFDWGPLSCEDEAMGDHQLTDWAIKTLKQSPRTKPLFLAVGYVKPHLPWYVPQKYFDRFPLDEIQLPAVQENDLADLPPSAIKMAKPDGDHRAVRKNDQWKQGVQGYLATISFLDDQVGRLLQGLEDSGRADDTIVVWWTDHGWHLGEKQHWRKFALWNDATHTSLAITAPGITQPGQRCDAAVDYVSLYPTICELAGLPTPKHVQGPSWMPLLKDPDAEWDHPAICTHGRGNHAIYQDKWHLIRYTNGDLELYDRQNDPNEWNNLLGPNQDSTALQGVVNRLESQLPTLKQEADPLETPKKGGSKKNNKKK